MEQLINNICETIAEMTASKFAEKMKKEEKTLSPLLDVNEVARLTGYAVRTIYQMSSNGTIAGKKKMGGKLMFERDKIESWISNR